MYSKNQKKKLIINADDFGWCEERDSGIIDLYQNKKISSISVLINGPNAQKSLQNAIKYNIPIGIHINLTEGTPISNSNDKNSLLKLCENTNNYIFHGKFEVPQLIKSGKIDKIDVFKEIHAQVKSI